MRRVASLCLLLLVSIGSAFADTIHDPIIDMEPGSGTVPFNGSGSFTILATDSRCTFSDHEGFKTCGTVGHYISPTDGFGNVLSFGNVTPDAIKNMEFIVNTFAGATAINVDQGIFRAPTTEESPTALFRDVTQTSGIRAVFSGSTIFNNCSFPDIEGPLSCDNEGHLSEFTLGFAEVLIPDTPDGSATISFKSNVPIPEPGSCAVLASGLCALWVVRKRILKHSVNS